VLRRVDYVKKVILEIKPDQKMVFYAGKEGKEELKKTLGVEHDPTGPLPDCHYTIKGKMENGVQLSEGRPGVYHITTKEIHEVTCSQPILAACHAISREHTEESFGMQLRVLMSTVDFKAATSLESLKDSASALSSQSYPYPHVNCCVVCCVCCACPTVN
jgi:hypothetical protein